MTVSWPAVLSPRSMSVELRGSAVSGGRSNTGAEQRAFSSAGRWEIRYEIPVFTKEKARAWRAMLDRLRAGEDILVKVFDRWRADGAEGAEPSAAITSPVSTGATTVEIAVYGLAVEAGVPLSIGQRLYRVNQVLSEVPSLSIFDIIVGDKPWSNSATWAASGSIYTVKILPPLRASATGGADVEFSDLSCLCVVADLSEGDLNLDLGKFGTPTITFREA